MSSSSPARDRVVDLVALLFGRVRCTGCRHRTIVSDSDTGRPNARLTAEYLVTEIPCAHCGGAMELDSRFVAGVRG